MSTHRLTDNKASVGSMCELGCCPRAGKSDSHTLVLPSSKFTLENRTVDSVLIYKKKWKKIIILRYASDFVFGCTHNSLPLPVVPVLGTAGMIFPSSSCWVLTYLVFLSGPYTAFSYHGGNDWRGKLMLAINTKPALWLHKAISPRVLRTPSLYCESCGCLLCKTRVKLSSWCSEPFSPTQLSPPFCGSYPWRNFSKKILNWSNFLVTM